MTGNIFEGKSFLITQPLIYGINGSTLVTLELASYIQSQGANVIVYTLTLGNPAKELFEQNNLHVDVAKDEPVYSLDQFDYIWVHSQVLPLSIVRELSNDQKKMPTFIFLHMSSMDWLPDEHPYIYELEEKLASKALYISETVRESNLAYFNEEPPYDYFRNPAPPSFEQKKTRGSKKLKKILFVSNYLPPELREARDILDSKGYETLILGEKEDKYELLELETLNKYDAVVSIAKTVHYCLVSGTPIYIYGKFGGAGWITESNYEAAKSTNFCGSHGFGYKNAETIVDEIENGFAEAQTYQIDNLEKFQEELLIKNVLKKILENTEKKEIKKFSEPYKNSVISAEWLTKIKFENGSRVRDRDKKIKKLKNDNEKLKKKLNSKTVKAAIRLGKLFRRKK